MPWKIKARNANKNFGIIRSLYEVIRLCWGGVSRINVQDVDNGTGCDDGNGSDDDVFVIQKKNLHFHKLATTMTTTTPTMRKNNDFQDKAITSCLIFTSKHSLDSHVMLQRWQKQRRQNEKANERKSWPPPTYHRFFVCRTLESESRECKTNRILHRLCFAVLMSSSSPVFFSPPLTFCRVFAFMCACWWSQSL